MPPTILRKSPSCLEASARVERLPSEEALINASTSTINPFRFERTCSMVSLIKTFLPGNRSSGASKLPLPNSATQAIAFFLIEI